MKRRLIAWFGVALALGAAALLSWSFIALPGVRETFSISLPDRVDFPAGVQADRLMITVEHPKLLRLGESGKVILSVKPEASQSKNEVVAGVRDEVVVYWVFESRLEMPTLTVLPPDLTRETYLADQTVWFFWSLTPQHEGEYLGTMWLYLSQVYDGERKSIQDALLARRVDVRVITLMGMNLQQIRWAGVAALVFGLAACLPSLKGTAH